MPMPLVPLLAAALALAPPPDPAEPRPEPIRTHALEVAAHPWDPATMDVPLRPSPAPKRAVSPDAAPHGLTRIVYGYLPYWVDANTVIHWDRLTHLAYFEAPVTADGTIASVGQQRLAGARFAALRTEAATHGVPLVVTFTNFDNATIGALVSTKRATTVASIVDAVKTSGAQGANIDFETVPGANRADFVAFMRDLATALKAEVPGAHVTMATPMIDWSNAYDLPALLDATDGAMVMIYGCRYGASSTSGPVSPLTKGDFWGRCSASDTLDAYRTLAGEERRAKVIAGFPLYGYRWNTAGDAPKSAISGTGESQRWNTCRALYTGGERRWDSDSETPWTTFLDAGTRVQVWCDDAESLGRKLDLLTARDVGGVGLWALGYEGDATDVWDRLATYAVPSNTAPVAIVGASQSVLVGKRVVLDGSKSSDLEGDPLTFRWTQVEGPVVALSNPGVLASFTATQVGSYAFELVVNDGTVDSAPARAEVAVNPVDAVPGGGGDGPKPCGCGGPDASLLALPTALLLARRRRTA